ncbi:MAG: MmcQ/YjbR family DNA-binding protein [Bacteroidia bacterium]
MDIETLRNYCLKKKGIEECFPFNETVLVFKVGGKMFLLADIDEKPLSFNAKCDPDKAVSLRESFDFIHPGYHMSKKHWNTIVCDGRIAEKMALELIDESYALVFNSLSKKIQAEISMT